MAKPLIEIVKEYPERGPLKQFRFAESISFSCFRCDQNKTSKLITIYKDSWDKKLCNGCYGCLLSIYDVKHNTSNTEEKVQSLEKLLLELIKKEEVTNKIAKIKVIENRNAYLSELAIKFYATSECVADKLETKQDLDWSPAVIGICKSFEYELLSRVILVIKSLLKENSFDSQESKDDDWGKIASFCLNDDIKPPEFGTIGHFINTAIHSKDRASKSSFLKNGLFAYLKERPKSDWIIDNNGLVKQLKILTTNFRNKAAHTDELNRNDYISCKEFVFGQNGIMWQLIISSERKKN